jgi:CBS domain-containing protein
MSLDRFCRKALASTLVTESIVHAAMVMREQHVGAVVALDSFGRPAGILTDRDISCRVVAEGRDPVATPVSAVMTPSPATLRRTDTIDDASLLLRQRGVRRAPIVDEVGRFIGLVSLDDLVVLFSAELGQLAAVVRDNKGP